MTINTGGGGINITARIGMSPAQAQQVAGAAGRAFGQAFTAAFNQATGQGASGGGGGGGGNPFSRMWGGMQGGIQAAGYGNYTGPRTPGVMAATYLWRGMLGRGTVSGMFGRLGATALGFGALGTLPQAVGEHIQTSKQQEQSLSDLNRRTGESFQRFRQFREEVLSTGQALGYTRDQILQMTNAYVSGVGRMDAVALNRSLQSSMQLGKAYGIDPQAIVGLQTQLFRGGSVGGNSGMTPQGLNTAFAAAVEFGGMRGREQEVVSAIEDLNQMLERRMPIVSPGMAMSMMGLMTAMNASGNQGLMGSRGVGLLSSVNEFASGSGGGAKRNLMFQMIQAQRASQGLPPLDYASLMYQAEEGLGNMGNQRALAFGINNFLPQGPYQNAFMAEMLGITMHQAEALGPILGNPQSFGGFDRMQGIIGGRDVNAMTLPFLARALGAGSLGGAVDVAGEFSGTMSNSAAGAFMNKVRSAGTADEVASLIVQYAGDTEQLMSAADTTTKAFTDFGNSLTDLAGQLNKVLTESLQAWTNIFNLLGGGAGAVLDMTNAASVAAFAIYAMVGAAGLNAAKSGISGLGNMMFGGIPGVNTAGPPTPGTTTGRGMWFGRGLRAAGPLSAIFGGVEAAADIASGEDPLTAILHRGFTTAASILGGAGGAALGGGVASIPLGAAGAIGGNLLAEEIWQRFFKPNPRGATATSAATGGVLGGRNPWDFDITQGYGANVTKYGPHTGTDFGMPLNTSIAALQSGIVARTRQEGMGGNIMELQYDSGYRMSLAHLNKFLLGEGERFEAGQAVALSGNTGSAVEGAHLHMEVRDALGRLMDPEKWYQNLRLQGSLDLTVRGGGMDGQYRVPVTIGGGTMAGLLTGSYGQ